MRNPPIQAHGKFGLDSETTILTINYMPLQIMFKKSFIVLALLTAPVLAADYFYVASTFEAESADISSINISLAPAEFDIFVAGEEVNIDFSSLLTLTASKDIDSRLIVWKSSALPSGLVFNNGKLSGIAPVGLDAVTVSVSYKGKAASQTYDLTSKIVIAETADGRRWSDGSIAPGCEQYIRPTNTNYIYQGEVGSGAYVIQPIGLAPISVYCEMEREGGGWTLASFKNGAVSTPGNIFVSEYNKNLASDKDRPNTLMSLNLETISRGLNSKDIMVVAPAFSAAPRIELNQGIWSYDQPDCNGPVVHTGRNSGCTGPGPNDNWDTYDRFNISFSDQSGIIPNYPHTHASGVICYPGMGSCDFEVYFR